MSPRPGGALTHKIEIVFISTSFSMRRRFGTFLFKLQSAEGCLVRAISNLFYKPLASFFSERKFEKWADETFDGSLDSHGANLDETGHWVRNVIGEENGSLT